MEMKGNIKINLKEMAFVLQSEVKLLHKFIEVV